MIAQATLLAGGSKSAHRLEDALTFRKPPDPLKTLGQGNVAPMVFSQTPDPERFCATGDLRQIWRAGRIWRAEQSDQAAMPMSASSGGLLSAGVLRLGVFVLGVLGWGPQHVSAQQDAGWLQRPYRVLVWTSLDSTATWSEATWGRLAETLANFQRSRIGTSWRLEFDQAPPTMRLARMPRAALPSAESARLADGTRPDKVVLLTLLREHHGVTVQAQCWDRWRGSWGAIVQRRSPNRPLGWLAWQALIESFSPVGRIRQLNGARVVVEPQAARLPIRDKQWAPFRRGAVLVPYRRQPAFQELPWTYLVVEATKGTQVICRAVSRYSQPLEPLRDHPEHWLVIQLPNTGQATLLTLVAAAGPDSPSTAGQASPEQASPEQASPHQTSQEDIESASNAPDRQPSGSVPLQEYELWSRSPGQSTFHRLGVTNRQGQFIIPPDPDSPLRIVHVRRGVAPVGTLPLVPGQPAELTVALSPREGGLTHAAEFAELKAAVADAATRYRVLLVQLQSFRDQGDTQRFRIAQSAASTLLRGDADVLRRRLTARQQELAQSGAPADQALAAELTGLLATLSRHLDPDLLTQIDSGNY